MRLRTLPLSLAGVVCGGLLAQGEHGDNWWAFALVLLTACALQVLSNLSNEMGDHLSGVDGEGREGPNYSMTDGGLSVKQMWRAINGTVVACCVIGLAMVLVSGSPWWVLLLGAAAIWAATHYTLGKKPYGYRGLGDLFVFIFFGLVSVLGSYFVIAHTIDFKVWLIAPAVGMGLLSVGVLNINNIRDMATDNGIRKTVPLLIGVTASRWYQTALCVVGFFGMIGWVDHSMLSRIVVSVAAAGLGVCMVIVWREKGRKLDKALPLWVISTFVLAISTVLAHYGL